MDLLLYFIALLIVVVWISNVFSKSKSSSLMTEASDYFATQIKASKADKLIETQQALASTDIKIEELVAFKSELDKI